MSVSSHTHNLPEHDRAATVPAVPAERAERADSGRLGLVARALDQLIRAYQWLAAGRVSPCRYVPSCSTYAREALVEHGALRGSLFALRRLLRCHPWGGHGYDPVPERPASTRRAR